LVLGNNWVKGNVNHTSGDRSMSVPDAGKDLRWEEMGITEDEMVGWHH